MLLVDSNVLIDILEDDPEWAEWSIRRLSEQSQLHEIAINPVVYAEVSLAFSTLEAWEAALAELGLTMLEMPRPALFLAGKAFMRYRREGGTKTNVLPDFFIGAHAAVAGLPLLTRDARRYRTYFPSLEVISP